MKRLLLPLFSLLLAYPTFCQPTKYQAESKVKKVIIYPSGARVERTASISIFPGRSEISFTGLSNQLDQESVQLSSDAPITLLAVHTTRDFLGARKIDEDEKEFQKEITELQDKLEMDKKMLEVCKDEESMLEKNQSIAGQQGVKLADLKEGLDFQRQRLSDLFTKELELQKRIKTGERKILTIQRQMAETSKKKDSVNFVVTALIESKLSRPVNFSLLYNVKDAGWYPTFDVRLKGLSDPINITMNANIHQQSGESWRNIALELSTGNPNENATASQVEPWYLGFYDPSVSFRRSAAGSGQATGRISDENGMPVNGASVGLSGSHRGTLTDANGYFRLDNMLPGSILTITAAGFQSMSIPFRSGYFSITLKTTTSALNEVVVTGYAPTNAETEQSPKISRELSGAVAGVQIGTVSVENQPTTMVYGIKDLLNLETDGKIISVGIKDLSVPALYQYYAAPKIDPSSFLTAQVLNWKDLDLQSGEANLYFEGSYLGKTYLNLEQPTDTLSLSMGMDNGVKVTRKLTKNFNSKSFIGSNRTETRQYEIILQNTKKDTVSIIVKDQIPVSTNKEIIIEDVEAPEGQIEKLTGIVTWKMNLLPGQEKKLLISYSVKYPKTKTLVLD
jgi:hypothetical protein